MERFEQLKKEDGADSLAAVAEPPSKEVIDALRQHFLSGEADFFHGGFIDCMESIGAVSSVSDPLVYGIEYNSWDMGNFDEIEHEARVRLLRYREYIEHQAAGFASRGMIGFCQKMRLLST